MNKEQFQTHMMRAVSLKQTGDRHEYWAGYMRGLRRLYHGENFGDQQQHELWLSLIDRSNATSIERGNGYRDGLEPDVK